MARSQEFESGSRPLRWSDLSPQERRVSARMISDRNANASQTLAAKAASVKDGSSEQRKFQAASKSPKLVEAPLSITKMKNALVKGMSQAAQPGFRLGDEPLAGVGFYFDHRAPIAEAAQASGTDVSTAITASARMSPRTSPDRERRTIAALGHAHQRGVVHFGPDLVSALSKGYVTSDGETKSVQVPDHMVGQSVQFRDLPAELVAPLRKRDFDGVIQRHSAGVDWDGLRSVAIDRNLKNAHRVLQGDSSFAADPYANPKQHGYEESIASAVPEDRDEYINRAQHLGRVLSGQDLPGQTTLDVTGRKDSNEGILSNQASIAADMWTRAKASGQQSMQLGSVIANTFIENKTGTDPGPRARGSAAARSAEGVAEPPSPAEVTVGARDPRITPVGIEHAAHQEAVERAAKQIQKDTGSDFTVPTRMVQETGGWAVPRREARKDPGFNAQKQKDDLYTSRKSHFSGGVQERLF